MVHLTCYIDDTQASGIDVADECISTFQQLKLGRQFKYILLTLNDDLSEIVVDKTSTASSYETFVEDLPKDQCRWAVYDFDFERDGLKRSKLCLVSWSVLFSTRLREPSGARGPPTLICKLHQRR